MAKQKTFYSFQKLKSSQKNKRSIFSYCMYSYCICLSFNEHLFVPGSTLLQAVEENGGLMLLKMICWTVLKGM